MNKTKDLTGQQFGRLVVLERAGDKYGKPAWKCQCSCGSEPIIVGGQSLKRGNSQSCGCSRVKDLTGQTFNRWTVIKRVENNKRNSASWLCKCECGKEKTVTTNGLLSGWSKSCGCLQKEKMSEARAIDITGKVFGKLTVLECVNKGKCNTPGSGLKWKCQCSCGSEPKIIASNHLLNGTTQSCGCLIREVRSLPDGEAALNAVIRFYKRHAKEDEREFLLSKNECKEKLMRNCTYCGTQPSNVSASRSVTSDFTYNGIDRIDNNKDYVIDNINPCCWWCNEAKWHYSLDEFYTWIKTAHEYMNLAHNQVIDRIYTQTNTSPEIFSNSALKKKLNKCRHDAKIRGFEFSLTTNEFQNRIFDNCFYCGKSPSQKVYSIDKKHFILVNGIDRRDNKEGYISDNSVPCCAQCNHAKNKYTETEFYEHIKKNYNFLNLIEY